jgi:hypothetical protein
LMCEEETLTAIRFAPIEPVPWFGLTTRENWLPTERQASFMDLIQKRIVRSLMPTRESQLAVACSGPRRKRPALATP